MISTLLAGNFTFLAVVLALLETKEFGWFFSKVAGRVRGDSSLKQGSIPAISV